MYGIEVLERDHRNIVHFTDCLEEEALKILQGQEINLDYLRESIRFIRLFCDKYHHQKEEDLLFKRMVFEIGDLAKKLIHNGMLVEHNLARSYVLKLEESLEAYEKSPEDIHRLNILSYIMAYVHLLRDHANKENVAVYPFGENHLSKEGKDWVDEETRKFEEDPQTKALYEEFASFIEENPYRA